MMSATVYGSIKGNVGYGCVCVHSDGCVFLLCAQKLVYFVHGYACLFIKIYDARVCVLCVGGVVRVSCKRGAASRAVRHWRAAALRRQLGAADRKLRDFRATYLARQACFGLCGRAGH